MTNHEKICLLREAIGAAMFALEYPPDAKSALELLRRGTAYKPIFPEYEEDLKP